MVFFAELNMLFCLSNVVFNVWLRNKRMRESLPYWHYFAMLLLLFALFPCTQMFLAFFFSQKYSAKQAACFKECTKIANLKNGVAVRR
jgi:hypothetical protein